MSLWRPETLRAGIETGRVFLMAHRPQGDVEAGARAVVPGGDAVAALRELLAAEARRVRRIDIVVSDAMAHFLVFGRLSGVRGAGEMRLALAALFEERFGASPAQWTVAADIDPFAASGLACALPRVLVDGCIAACRSAGLREISIVPFFVAAVRGAARRIGRNAWVLARADGQVTLAQRAAGVWTTVRAQPATDDDSAELLVARERLRLGQEHGEWPVFALGRWPSAADERSAVSGTNGASSRGVAMTDEIA